MSQTIYCISGLGADHRIFADLAIPGVSFKPVPWLIPEKGELLRHYALRMKQQVPDERPILLGVSFGGMMAIEMAFTYPEATVILVSSVSHREQLPWWMRVSGRLRLNRLVHLATGRRASFPEKYLLGVETKADLQLVNEFREHSDPRYLTWAIDQIVNWRNEWIPPSFFHLHGGRDRMFPIRRIKATRTISDGGHFMVKNRAAEVSRLLEGFLNVHGRRPASPPGR